MGKAKRECIEYAGGKYYKQPTGYYRTSHTKGDKLLHVQMYQDYWDCIIPKGFVVHHKDNNNENNTIDNYFLLTRAGHQRWHHNGTKHSEETKEKNTYCSHWQSKHVRKETFRGSKRKNTYC